jgi:hypothetical protein
MKQATDRARRHTARAVLQRIDDVTVASLNRCAVDGPHAVGERLQALDREWDVDRVLEVEAATMGLLGVTLGAFVDRRLLALPAIVSTAVLVFATTGRYPLLPLFRRLGIRSSREISRERHALKALRGDFAGMEDAPARAATAAHPASGHGLPTAH